VVVAELTTRLATIRMTTTAADAVVVVVAVVVVAEVVEAMTDRTIRKV
jgi:hypothetical protein